MSLFKSLALTSCVALAGVFLVSKQAVFAHGGASGVVKERMELMEVLGQSMKTVGSMARGKQPYDARSVKMAGEAIAAHGGEALTTLFPEGSLDKPTEVRPDLWSNWDEFVRIAEDLQSAGNGLSSAAKDAGEATSIPDEVAAAFAKVGQTCSACHKSFRIKH